MKPTKKFIATNYDKDFQTWVGRWLYSFANYIETKREEEDSMTKLLLFISKARSEGKVNTGLVDALAMFIQDSFKCDLPCLCLRQFLDTPGGCYADNCFTERDNSALKCDVCGPKANNKLHIAVDATITHTDGQWQYAPVPEMELEIVLPDGSTEGIALLPAEAARVTLGVCTSPDGDDSHHLQKLGKAKDKRRSVATRANVWLDRLKNGHLPPKYSWVSYRLQLWSSLKYGLGTLSAPLSTLGEITTNFAFRALPFLGVNRNIRAEWRYLHNSFGGVGLLSLATETMIGRVNLFLQHWDMPTPIGNMLRASMELLQLEVECAGCPLKSYII
jgi:hypothetical protein